MSAHHKMQSLRVIREGLTEVLCLVDGEQTQEVQNAMRVLARAAKTPIGLSLVDVATGIPVRRFSSSHEAGRKGAVR